MTIEITYLNHHVVPNERISLSWSDWVRKNTITFAVQIFLNACLSINNVASFHLQFKLILGLNFKPLKIACCLHTANINDLSISHFANANFRKLAKQMKRLL